MFVPRSEGPPLTFIHKTAVVENHPTKREITELLRPRSTPTGITVYFYMTISLIYIHVRKIHRRKLQTASDENIMENNIMFVMLWNLSVISHIISPRCFFFISGGKSKNNILKVSVNGN